MQDAHLSLEIDGRRVHLYNDSSLYEPDAQRLVVSDLHLGKAGYFQRNGLPLSLSAELLTMTKLSWSLARTPVRELLLLGDLFHVADAAAMDSWASFLQKQTGLRCILVKGNHERLPASVYMGLGMEVVTTFKVAGWEYVHDRSDGSGAFCISGHEHPGIRLRGPGRQYLRLPCFRYTDKGLILPSFGRLTGLYCRPKALNERIFVVWPEGIKAL